MSLKQKIRSSNITLGSWLSSGSLIVADLMSKSNLDWIVLDNEHSMMDYETILSLITQVQANQKSCFVRVGANDPLIIKKCLDAGANGIVVPMIKSLADAKNAINNTFYPNIGTRGVGLYRAQEYGYGFDSYKQNHIKETVLILQIEHIDAIKELDKMAELEQVDGFIIGPYDLSASMGIAGEFQNTNFLRAVSEIESIVKKSHKALGTHIIQPEHEQIIEKTKSTDKDI